MTLNHGSGTVLLNARDFFIKTRFFAHPDSVVDPDPVGSETFSRILIRNEFEKKLL
jgi:hypothetical protein